MIDRRILAGAAAVVVVAAGAWTYFADRAVPDRADADDAALVALGRAVYAERCASCHGANLEGQPDWRSPLPDGGRPAPPHDPSGHTWHHPDRLLFGITREGGQKFSPPAYRNNMPGFADVLSEREIWASLAYIKSRWPAQIRARQADIDRRSR